MTWPCRDSSQAHIYFIGSFYGVSLLQFFIVCASLVSYVEVVSSLFVPHLSFFWCLGTQELVLKFVMPLKRLKSQNSGSASHR